MNRSIVSTFVLVLSCILLVDRPIFSVEKYIQGRLLAQPTIEFIEYSASKGHNLGQYLLAQHQPVGSNRWQSLLISASETMPEAATLLATHYAKDPVFQLKWLKKAAELGSLDDKTEYAIALQNTDVKTAEKILFSLKNSNQSALRALILLQVNHQVLSEPLIKQLDLMSAENQQLISTLKKYSVIPALNNITHQLECPMPIQWFATNIDDLVASENYISLLNSDTELSRFYCFLPVRYISLPALNCYQEKNKQHCDESVFSNTTIDTAIKYLAVTLPNTTAYANKGIIYVDKNDSLQVVKHELLHLAGFVDEYPLPDSHKACELNNNAQLSTEALNLVITKGNAMPPIGDANLLKNKILDILPWRNYIKETTQLFTVNNGKLLLGTPDNQQDQIGLFRSDTCTNSSTFSWKATHGTTTLEHHELPIPNVYLSLLAQNTNFIAPSYHYNIALVFNEQAQVENANLWLTKALSFETSPERIEKLKQGRF